MTDFYCDHGAYGLASNRLGLDTPTWGVPQEGDGSSINASGAASTFSIDLTSFTSNAGTFALFGSSAISVGAAASGATLATQIAAAINASVVTTGNAATFPGAPMIKNAFYATTSGAVLNIMCRIGSTLTNALGMVWAGTWTSAAPTAGTFAGGTGGCWGWFFNPTAMGAGSSIAAGGYGLFFYKPYVSAGGAIPLFTDNIYVRTGGGASKTISFSALGAATITPACDKSLIFDTNTKWTGDITTGVLKFTYNTSGYAFTTVLQITARKQSFRCLNRGNFEFEAIPSTNSTFTIGGAPTGIASYAYFDGVTFRDSSAISTISLVFGLGAYTSFHFVTLENCDWKVTNPKSNLNAPFYYGSYGSYTSLTCLGCTFDFNISGLTFPGYICLGTGAGYINSSALKFISCDFKGYSPGYTILDVPIAQWVASITPLTVVIENCSGIAMPTGYGGIISSATFQDPNLHLFILSNTSSATSPGLRVENCRGSSEWVPNDPTPFPYLNSTVQGIGTGYSIRVIWLSTVGHTDAFSYESMPLRIVNQLASAVRTLTLEMFIPTIVTHGIRAAFEYVDATGKARHEVTTVIAASSAVWTNNASYGAYASKKMSVTTQYAVSPNAEISCRLLLVDTAPAATVALYLDPEFTVV